MARVIDAHQHYWRVDAQDQPWRQAHHDAIARDFEPADLRPRLERAGVTGTVVVQSVDGPAENDRLVHYAAEPSVAGVVSWLPVAATQDARAELARLSIPKHVGVRCLIGDDPLDWLGDAETIALFRELAERRLAWDVVPISSPQVENVARLADAVPELQIVIDHLGRPPVDTAGWNPWAADLERLAAQPNTAIKVSIGLNVLASWEGWDAAAIGPYVAHAVAAFGADRIMLASNWPVIELAADYERAWADLSAQTAASLGEERSAAALGENAERIYRLDRA